MCENQSKKLLTRTSFNNNQTCRVLQVILIIILKYWNVIGVPCPIRTFLPPWLLLKIIWSSYAIEFPDSHPPNRCFGSQARFPGWTRSGWTPSRETSSCRNNCSWSDDDDDDVDQRSSLTPTVRAIAQKSFKNKKRRYRKSVSIDAGNNWKNTSIASSATLSPTKPTTYRVHWYTMNNKYRYLPTSTNLKLYLVLTIIHPGTIRCYLSTGMMVWYCRNAINQKRRFKKLTKRERCERESV